MWIGILFGGLVIVNTGDPINKNQGIDAGIRVADTDSKDMNLSRNPRIDAILRDIGAISIDGISTSIVEALDADDGKTEPHMLGQYKAFLTPDRAIGYMAKLVF